jgi:type II secretory ATPase GspE/PulE/Tfp pilus assembly ATPase PilB-like protein
MSTQTAKEQELESHIQSMGTTRQEDEARQRASALSLSYSDGTTLPLDSGAMKTLPQEACVRAQLIVTFKEGKGIVVATVNPEAPEAKELLGQLKETFSAIRIFVVSTTTFTSLVAQYPSQTDAPIATSGVIAIADVSADKALHAIGDLAGSLKGLTASDAMARLLTGALALKGSDIHLEPEASSTRIRIRVDGFLHDAGALESSQAGHIVDRIKILSGTKLNITKAPKTVASLFSNRHLPWRLRFASSIGTAVHCIRLPIDHCYARQTRDATSRT